jgi:hypothetical protein
MQENSILRRKLRRSIQDRDDLRRCLSDREKEVKDECLSKDAIILILQNVGNVEIYASNKISDKYLGPTRTI